MTPQRTRSPKAKPLPLTGWLVAAGLCAAMALVWYFWARENNQWTYLPGYGVRLPLRFEVHGIDVSHHNGTINWERVKAMKSGGVGVDFVFVKATEGATHLDRQYYKNWRALSKLDLARGAYHFYNPRVLSTDQANHFVKHVKLRKGDLPPVLDVEITGGKSKAILVKGVNNWLRLIEAHYGVKPIVYTSEHFYHTYLEGEIEGYDLWLAAYSKFELKTADESLLRFWQHTDRGYVEGIRGKVDLNAFMGTREAWQALPRVR